MKEILTFIILITTIFTGIGQSVENIVKIQDTTVIYEKVYLQIDREYYYPGDTLWFKVYLVNGITNKLEVGYKNIYVQLISPTGEVINHRLLMSVFGTSHGDMALRNSLPSGQYTVRAYTKYQENFGENSYFHKKVWIAKPEDFEKKDSIQTPEPELGEVLFFPEGGNLVVNTANHVAFKAIGKNGKGIEASGSIINNSGQTVAIFNTSFQGMGQFIIMPKEGEVYYVIINGHPDYKCQFPEIREEGIVLHCKDETKDILVSLSRNYNINRLQTFYLVARHKGMVLFYKTIAMNSFEQVLRLNKSSFPLGISKISIINSEMDIVSERLLFISDGQLTTVKISTDNIEYSTRDSIKLSIEPMLAADDSITSTLSVAIVNEDYFSSEGITQTIQSYLLLDSEITGAIESPANYFINEDSITSAQKLDLLMMVQGWRSYYWDEIIIDAPSDFNNWDDAGISISGNMKNQFKKDIIVRGKVQLSSFSPLLVEKNETDSLGQFCFERLFLKDSAEVILIGENKKGRKNVVINIDELKQCDTLGIIESINSTLSEIGVPMKYAKDNQIKQVSYIDFDIENGGIMLEEVNVSARKIEKAQQVTFYKPYMYLADNSYFITRDDYIFETVNNFLIKKVELPVRQYKVLPDGSTTSLVHYNLDGENISVDESNDKSNDVLSLPIQDIYQIDVDKNVKVIRALVYVYTKKLDLREPSYYSLKAKKIIRVQGFQQPNKFYSPKYTFESINNIIPDFRTTLYWMPELEVREGKAEIDFFAGDILSNYIAITEGISQNGKICFGLKRFTINKKNVTK